METKDQFQKILDWMRQLSRNTATVKDLQDAEERLSHQISLIEQFQDRTRFKKEIQKIRQEIRELMH